MEEHVGEPDSTRTNGEEGDVVAPSDYLESLRARFDELASRIEAATQESLERTQSFPLESGESDSSPPDETPDQPAAASPIDETPSEDTTEASEPQDEPHEPAAEDSPPTAPAAVATTAAEDSPEPSAAAAERSATATGPANTAEQPQADVDPPPAPSTTADAPIAHAADLDAWDETAPPVAPTKGPRSSSRPSGGEPDNLSDPQTLGAELRTRMRPETGPHRRRKMVVRTLIAVIFLAMAAGAAWWWLQGNSHDAAPVAANTEEPTPTTAPTEPTAEPDRPDTAQAEAAESAATQALVAGGLAEIAVTVEDGIAVLTGSVASEDTKAAAAAAVGSVAGVSAVDNQIVVEPPPPVDPAEVPAAAEQARDEAGFGHLGVTVIDGTATITGIVPLAELDGGYFAYTAPLREALLAINGIDAVRTRLQLRGEVGTLSRQLDELVAGSPIVFAAGSTELTPQDELVLDEAAVIISESPGLVVLVAGHTDPAGEDAANAVLAQERADTVVAYLTGRGIPVTRLAPVTFGELFPSPPNAPEAGQGILFEVTP